MQRPSRRAERLIGVALVAAAMPAVAASGDVPAFRLIRADEDWSMLADGVPRPGVPAFKYIAWSDAPHHYVSLGGEVRERFDVLDAPRYGIGTSRDSYLLQRLLMHADLHLGERLRVFAQLGREDSIGRVAPGPSDIDRGDVQNLFADVTLDAEKHGDLRVGRQELQFNPTQRFVAVREGPNVRQSFDGLRATWSGAGTRLDLFATRPVSYSADAFDDKSDPAQNFSGAYLTHEFGAGRLDLYALHLGRDDAVYHGRHADERRDSVGARYAGQAGAWDLDIEALEQSGRFGRDDVRAWAASAIAGYTLAARAAPRLGVEVDAGSGGRDEGDIRTFHPLFPKGAYFNEASLFSWSNSIVVRPSLTLTPRPTLTLQASVLYRWRENRDDAVYVQPALALPATLSNRERRIGTTTQFDATWRATRALTFALQLAHNAAGPAIRHAGGHATDFALVSAQFRY